MERKKSYSRACHWSESKDAAATVRGMGCRSRLATAHNLWGLPANKSPSKSLRRKSGTNIPMFDILLLIPTWHSWRYFGGRALFLVFKRFILLLQWNVTASGLVPSVKKLEMQSSQSATQGEIPAGSPAGKMGKLCRSWALFNKTRALVLLRARPWWSPWGHIPIRRG